MFEAEKENLLQQPPQLVNRVNELAVRSFDFPDIRDVSAHLQRVE